MSDIRENVIEEAKSNFGATSVAPEEFMALDVECWHLVRWAAP